MTINFQNPKTKDKIIFILKKTPKLTTKQIFSKLKSYEWNYSYQSVHKILKELVDDNIITRKNNSYSLSELWLKDLKNFLNDTKIRKEKIGSTIIHTFSSISELDKYLFDFGKEFDKKSGKSDKVYWEANHYWWPIAYSKEMYDTIIKREENHISEKIFLSKNPLDKWCADYYKKLGVKVKYKLWVDGPKYFAIYKKTRLEIILPEQIEFKLDRFFSKVKSFEDIDLRKFYRSILNKRTKIKVILSGI